MVAYNLPVTPVPEDSRPLLAFLNTGNAHDAQIYMQASKTPTAYSKVENTPEWNSYDNYCLRPEAQPRIKHKSDINLSSSTSVLMPAR